MWKVSHACVWAFGIVADSETLRHDEAPYRSLLLKSHSSKVDLTIL